jgi:hypothetical protein
MICAPFGAFSQALDLRLIAQLLIDREKLFVELPLLVTMPLARRYHAARDGKAVGAFGLLAFEPLVQGAALPLQRSLPALQLN